MVAHGSPDRGLFRLFLIEHLAEQVHELGVLRHMQPISTYRNMMHGQDHHGRAIRVVDGGVLDNAMYGTIRITRSGTIPGA